MTNVLPATAKTMSFIITRDREKARAFYGGGSAFQP